MPSSKDLVARAGLFAAGLASAGSALAAEPRRFREPSVLREPAEITQVVDAFDDDDLFDLSLSLGFASSRRSGKIFREDPVSAGGKLKVAEFESTVNRLTARAELGLFKDIALLLRLPLVLSHSQRLQSLDGSAAQQAAVLQGVAGEQLFRLPFESPTRSGIEHLAVGVDLALTNQARDATKPSWVVGLEARFDVSEPMHACGDGSQALNLDGPQVRCADPGDVNRDGVPQGTSGSGAPERAFSGEQSPGVSRGSTAIELHSYVSRRVKYVEPYGGFRGMVEFPGADSEYAALDQESSPVNNPPLRGTLLVGINLIPWEIRDLFQRITIDLRFSGTYVSAGRDYSELFDALGSSDAPSLRAPSYAEYRANPDPASAPGMPSVVDAESRAVYFSGLTHVQAHTTYQLSAAFTWQAGEYVKFNLGTALGLTQGHFITFDEACNRDFEADPSKSGTCRSGVPNPSYRSVLNQPGHRFRVEDAIGLDAWLNATVLF